MEVANHPVTGSTAVPRCTTDRRAKRVNPPAEISPIAANVMARSDNVPNPIRNLPTVGISGRRIPRQFHVTGPVLCGLQLLRFPDVAAIHANLTAVGEFACSGSVWAVGAGFMTARQNRRR